MTKPKPKPRWVSAMTIEVWKDGYMKVRQSNRVKYIRAPTWREAFEKTVAEIEKTKVGHAKFIDISFTIEVDT